MHSLGGAEIAEHGLCEGDGAIEVSAGRESRAQRGARNPSRGVRPSAQWCRGQVRMLSAHQSVPMIKQNILRLQVAVDHAHLMQMAEGEDGTAEDETRRRLLHRAL